MKNPLRTTEGFMVLLGIIAEGMARLWPDSKPLVDAVIVPAGTVIAARVYKKIITPGAIPFQPETKGA